jgi:hypothetical protein
MWEVERYRLTKTAAETIYLLWEAQDQQEGQDLDAKMRRLKDLSAYSLTHAEILEQREVVELLAIAMLFGATSDTRLWPNQVRLRKLSPETIEYQGVAKKIELEVRQRTASDRSMTQKKNPGPQQPRLL